MQTVLRAPGWNDDEPVTMLMRERGIYELSYEEAERWRLEIEANLKIEEAQCNCPRIDFLKRLHALFAPAPPRRVD